MRARRSSRTNFLRRAGQPDAAQRPTRPCKWRTTMTKMILTLVALAALGTAALAPTDASAFRHPAAKRAGGVHHAGRPAARPAHVRNFNIRIRLGARPAWHRGAVHGPVRFGYRPVWHRPGFVRGVGYAAPVAAIAAAPIATAPVQRAMGAQVNG